MKTLLVLPCNPGAKLGDYYKGKGLWPRFGKILNESGLKKDVDIAAIDCIITFLAKDGLGALVHETEMSRVFGYDAYPGQVFATDKVNKLQLLKNDLKIGISRWETQYDKIVVCSNVMPYRLAFRAAYRELGLENKVCDIEWIPVGVGISHGIIKETVKALQNDEYGIKQIPIDVVCTFKRPENKTRIEEQYKVSLGRYI